MIYGTRTQLSKPLPGQSVDRSHPLGAALVAAFPCSGGSGSVIDSITSNGLVLTNGSWTSGIHGSALDLTSTGAAASLTVPSAWKATLPITLVCEVDFTGTPSNGGTLFGVYDNTSASSPYYDWILGFGSSNDLVLGYNSGGSSATLAAGSPTSLANRGRTWIACVITSTSQAVYLDNPWTAYASASASISSPTYGATAEFEIGTPSFLGSKTAACRFHYGYVFNRALTSTELASLKGNPWQVYRRPQLTLGQTRATPVYRQRANFDSTGYVSTDTTLTLTGVQQGSTLLMAIGEYPNGQPTFVKDDLLNSFTLDGYNSSFGGSTWLYRLSNVTGGTRTVTVRPSGASFLHLCLSEWSNLTPTQALKSTATNYNPNSSGNTLQFGGVSGTGAWTSTPRSGDLIFVSFASANGRTGLSCDGGMTLLYTSNSGDQTGANFYMTADGVPRRHTISWTTNDHGGVFAAVYTAIDASFADLRTVCSLTADATVTHGNTWVATASLSSATTVSGSGKVAHPASSTLSCVATVSVTARVAHPATASLSSVATLTSTGKVSHPCTASLSSVSTVSGVGRVAHPCTASLACVVTLTSTPRVSRTITSTLGSVVTLTASAHVAHTLSATLSGVASVVTLASVLRTVSATLTAECTCTGTASSGFSGPLNSDVWGTARRLTPDPERSTSRPLNPRGVSSPN